MAQPSIPLRLPKQPPGVFILWMNDFRTNLLSQIFSGSNYRFGSEEIGICFHSLKNPKALEIGTQVIDSLKSKYETLQNTIANIPNHGVSAFDKEFAKFCGKIWQGYTFIFQNCDGKEVVTRVTDKLRTDWTGVHKFEMCNYRYNVSEYERWFRPHIYENKLKEIKQMKQDAEEEKWRLYDRLNEVENKIRGIEKIDIPYLELAAASKHHLLSIDKVDRDWFQKMVATKGAWSNAEI